MPFSENPYTPPKTIVGKGAQVPSPLSGFLVYLFPTVFPLTFLLLIGLIELILWKEFVPKHKLITSITVFAFTFPIGFVMRRYAISQTLWRQAASFWMFALLGGLAWSAAFSVLLQTGVVIVIAISNHFNGPYAIYPNIYIDFFEKTINITPFLWILLGPLHGIFMFRKRRFEQNTERPNQSFNSDATSASHFPHQTF